MFQQVFRKTGGGFKHSLNGRRRSSQPFSSTLADATRRGVQQTSAVCPLDRPAGSAHVSGDGGRGTNTGSTHQNFGLVHLLPDLADAGLLPVLDGEVTGAPSDLKEEGPQHLHAPLRQVHLGVELRPIQLLLLVSNAWWTGRLRIRWKFAC